LVRPKHYGLLYDEGNQSAPLLMGTQPGRSSHSVSTQRRLPTSGQIAALRDGSPISKHGPKSKFGFNSSQYGSEKRIQQPKTEVKLELKPRAMANAILSGGSSADSSSFCGPPHFDDNTRRSVKFGLGATVRSCHDAREIILGESRFL
jgi:hypothetical protein